MSEDFISHTIKILGPQYKEKEDKNAFLVEFEEIMENKKNDFPWTAKEMNNLWPLLDKYNRTDSTEELAEMILFEKILHFIAPKNSERAAWRDVFTHQDPILQRQVLIDLEKEKGMGYLKACEEKVNTLLNSFYLHQFDDLNIEVRSIFMKAHQNVALKILPILSNADRIIQEVS